MTKWLLSPIVSPRSGRHVSHFDELPIGHVRRLEPEIIPHGRRNIEAGTLVQVRLRPLILKDVLEMIGAERATIFPLRISDAIAFADRQPATAADRLTLRGVGLLEPRNDEGRLRLEPAPRHVVIRERDVKGILRGERN